MPSITLVWTPEWPNIPTGAGPEFIELERKITKVLNNSRQTILLTKVLLLAKGVKIICQTENCIEQLHSEYITKYLKEYCGLNFAPSRERIAKCTLVIRPYNEYVFELSEEEILTAARRAAGVPEEAKINLWRKKENKLIKLTFEHRTHADRAKNTGIGLGGFYFSSKQIEYAEHIPILQCMRCFEFEHHTTSECTAEQATCSECSREGHSFRTCVRPTPPQCVNCLKRGNDPNHRALANDCKVKKEIIRAKRKRKNQNEKQPPVIQAEENKISERLAPEKTSTPRVQATPGAWSAPLSKKNNKNKRKKTPPQPLPTIKLSLAPPEKKKTKPNENATKKVCQQIQILTILAHQFNAIHPGTFNSKLNQFLDRNHLPQVDVGEDWPSADILNALVEEDVTPMEEDGSVLRPSPNPSPTRIERPAWIADSISSGNSITLYHELIEMEKVIGKEETIGKEEKQERKKPKRKKERKKDDQKTEERIPELEEEEEAETTEQNTEEEIPELEEQEETEVEEIRTEEDADHETETETEEEEDEELNRLIHLVDSKEDLSGEDRLDLYYLYLDAVEWGVTLPRRVQTGIAYALAAKVEYYLNDSDEARHTDVYVELGGRGAMTIKEIQEIEEDYIKKAIEAHEILPATKEDALRLLQLARKEKLEEKEDEELKKMYKETAQSRLINSPNLMHRSLMAIYRTTGLAWTISTLEKRLDIAKSLVKQYLEASEGAEIWDF